MTVLGLGEMGRALAAAHLDAGHPITVWNRSPGRADALAARGATVAGSAEEAVDAAPGVSTEVIASVQALIRHQIAAGHGKDGFARIYEEIRSTDA